MNATTEEIITWKCPNGHVLGQVVRSGRGVRRLLLYREALDPDSDEQGEVDVISVCEGLVMDVRCSICGRVRTWVPGEEAMRRLLESLRPVRVVVEAV